MAISYTFSPPVDPDTDSRFEYKKRLLKVEFGAIDALRSGDGINTTPLTLNLTWTNLTASQQTAITSFLQARRAYQAFYYTYPGLTQLVWICENYSWQHDAPDNYTVTAMLSQVYDM